MERRAIIVGVMPALFADIRAGICHFSGQLQMTAYHEQVEEDRVLLRLEGNSLPDCCIVEPGQEFCKTACEVDVVNGVKILRPMFGPAESTEKPDEGSDRDGT